MSITVKEAFAVASPLIEGYRTQRITAKDRESGQIRVPTVGSAPTKVLFPTERATISVKLKGMHFQTSWDPRMGPDRERSGIIRVNADKLQTLVEDEEVLNVSVDNSGTYHIE